MKFEYLLEPDEQKLLDRLNKVQSMTPGKLVGIVLASLVPSIAILILIDSWFVLAALAGMTCFMIVTAIRQLSRTNKSKTLTRSFELTPVGKHETMGDSEMMIKWDLIDNIQENGEAFIFERLDRFSILPKRAIDENRIEEVREFLLKIRNQPESGHLPLRMFDELFNQSEGSTSYKYLFEEEDLEAATGPLMAHLKEGEFTLQDVVNRTLPSSNWASKILFFAGILGSVFILSLLVGDQTFTAALMVAALVLPFLLILISSKLRERSRKRNLPRIPREQYLFRLLPHGWAAGEPNAVSYHQWNANTNFYLSEHFVGIKSDTRLVSLIPNRAFDNDGGTETDGSQPVGREQVRARAKTIFEFLQEAMQTCRNRIQQRDREANVNTPHATPVESGNPYQAPQINRKS